MIIAREIGLFLCMHCIRGDGANILLCASADEYVTLCQETLHCGSTVKLKANAPIPWNKCPARMLWVAINGVLYLEAVGNPISICSGQGRGQLCKIIPRVEITRLVQTTYSDMKGRKFWHVLFILLPTTETLMFPFLISGYVPARATYSSEIVSPQGTS